MIILGFLPGKMELILVDIFYGSIQYFSTIIVFILNARTFVYNDSEMDFDTYRNVHA